MCPGFVVLVTLIGTLLLALVAGTSESVNKGSIIVAGNFSIDGKIVNVAQYDFLTGSWSAKRRSELFLYSENNGVIWDIAINRTSNPYDTMYIVGTFDTDARASQFQFCSVSEYDGLGFNKVGEGLCPRGDDSSQAMQLYTSVLGNSGDLYVGGTFESRVWNGHNFVNVYHAARYDARSMTWLPLVDGELVCTDGGTARVNALAWDPEMSILYLGGSFHALGNVTITSGLAMWTKRTGLIDFPGGGVLHSDGGVSNTQVKSIAYEPKSESLFISGLFRQVNDKPCSGVAAWTRWSNLWRCLADDAHSISVATSMLLTPTHLYLSGWAAATSSWKLFSAEYPYAIARIDITGFIAENDARNYDFSVSRRALRDGVQREADVVSQLESERPDTMGVYERASTNSEALLSSAVVSGVSGVRHIHRVHLYPESHPCVTETGVPACGVRPARHALLHSQRLRRRRTTAAAVQSAPNREHSSRSRHPGRVNREPTHENNHTARSLSTSTDEYNQEPRPHSAPAGSSSRSSRPAATVAGGITSYSGGLAGGGNHSDIPDPDPAPRPAWSVQWEWLQGFKGANGPIFRMTEGRDSLHDTILIAGAFNNYPAIVVWSTAAGMDNHLSAISSIPGSYALAGLITSVVQAYIPEDAPAPVPVPPPTPPPQPTIRTDYAFLVVVGGVGMGIVLGLVIAIGCLTRAGFQLVNLPPNLGHPKPDAPLGPGMPLTTLSGSGPGALADFRICFERAMSARHLPTHETLLIINPQEITLSRIIGEGSFGRVWNGNWRNNAVAVKEFVFAQAAIEGGSLQHNSIIEEIVGEAGIMACLRHPKILQLYGCSLTMQAIWIVSELCIRGSLRMVLSHKSVPLSTQTKLALCMDIADGMHYLHSRTPPIIHRDLKSLNIFITETSPGKLVAKIGDWGSARAVALTGQKSMTQGVGTACWLSPEVISNAHFSKHSDVYAFGIILWEVFTRQEVYAGLSAAQIISKVAHESLRPTIPRGCLWEQIMTSCWDRDPELRPSFNTVLQELNKILTAERGTLDGIPLDSIGQSEESDFLIPNNNSAQSSFDVTESSDWVTSGQGYPPKPLTLTPPRTPHHPPAHHTPSPSVPIAGGGSTGSNRHSAHKPKGVLKIRSDAPPALAASPSAEPTPRTSQPYMQGGLPPDSPGTSPGQFPRSASAPHVPATQGNIYRNELPLNFDVSDLIGPTYYIMKELSDDDIEADPLDFLFAKHKRAEAKPPLPVQASPTANHHHPRGSPVTTPPAATRTAAARAESPSVPEVYIGDKALKPYTSRKRSGSGASTNRSNH